MSPPAASLARSAVLIATAILVGSCTADGLLLPFEQPTASTVAPSSGVRGNTVHTTITGTGFVPSATLVKVGGTGVTVSNVSVSSSTSISADFVLAAGADLGAHEVTVTAPGGSVSAGAFG